MQCCSVATASANTTTIGITTCQCSIGKNYFATFRPAAAIIRLFTSYSNTKRITTRISSSINGRRHRK